MLVGNSGIQTRRPHSLNTDGIHDRYGPESPANHTALALADFYVGQLLDALKLPVAEGKVIPEIVSTSQ